MTEQYPQQQAHDPLARLMAAASGIAGQDGDPAATLSAVASALGALQEITHQVINGLAGSVAPLPLRTPQGGDPAQASSLAREVVARLGEARSRCLQAAAAASRHPGRE